MLYPPHAHFLVTGGGLSADGTLRIEPKHPESLVPGHALSVIFRAKVRDALRRAGLLGEVPQEVWSKDWVVHAQHAGSGEKVLDYLARYVFRIAITHGRLERFEQGQVTFSYRDSRTRRVKRCTVTAQEFIRRFLQHVLPEGFAKVRCYGLWSPSCKRDRDRARALLGAHAPASRTDAATSASSPQRSSVPTQDDKDRCPFCHAGRMRVIETLPPRRAPP